MNPLTSARMLVWLPLAAAVGLCVLLMWQAPRVEPLAALPESRATANEEASSPAENSREILLNWPLFGQAEGDGNSLAGVATSTEKMNQAVMPDDAVVLPPTALDVQVRGLAYSPQAKRAHAILQIDGGAQRRYRVGDTLADGVILRGVRPLEVVLDNQGQLESAALPVAPAALNAEMPSVLPATEPPAAFDAEIMTPPGGTVPGILPEETADPALDDASITQPEEDIP